MLAYLYKRSRPERRPELGLGGMKVRFDSPAVGSPRVEAPGVDAIMNCHAWK